MPFDLLSYACPSLVLAIFYPALQVWALRPGPYGVMLALTWRLGSPARLVDVDDPSRNWELPGLETSEETDVHMLFNVQTLAVLEASFGSPPAYSCVPRS